MWFIIIFLNDNIYVLVFIVDSLENKWGDVILVICLFFLRIRNKDYDVVFFDYLLI